MEKLESILGLEINEKIYSEFIRWCGESKIAPILLLIKSENINNTIESIVASTFITFLEDKKNFRIGKSAESNKSYWLIDKNCLDSTTHTRLSVELLLKLAVLILKQNKT